MAREISPKRVERKPLHQQGPQSIAGAKDPDYVYRFVNDTGSRIANFQNAGYEFVQDESMLVGDSHVSDASDIGSSKRVTSNDGTVSYLMRIKKEYYVEDQKAKLDRVAETERAMKPDTSQGMYGKISIT